MESLGLLTICTSAFLAVFLILSLCAVLIRLIIVIFPDPESKEDQAILAAISTTVNSHYPGTKITKIEEVK